MSKSLAEALGADHDDEPTDDGAPDYDEHGKAAMEAFISAVASKDSEAAWDALKTAVSLCGHDDGGVDDDPSGRTALMLIPHK